MFVRNVVSIRPTIEEKHSNISVVLLAARYGYRMKSFGTPCHYRNFKKQTLLENQIKTILSIYPSAEIVVVTGYQIKKLVRQREKYRLVENIRFQETNEIEDIRLALNNVLNRNILIISGDVYFNKYAIKNLNDSCLIFDTKNQIKSYDVGITTMGGEATTLAFDLHKTWCHITFFTDKEFDLLYNFCQKFENNRMFLFEAINQLIEKGAIFKVREPNNMLVFKIDTPEQYKYFTKKRIFL